MKCTDCRSVYQNPRVIPEDILLCYPAQYSTHQPARAVLPTSEAQHRPPFHAIPDRLKSVVRHYADGSSLDDSSFVLRMLGRLLATLPAARTRARAGIPDMLAAQGNVRRCYLESGPGTRDKLAALSRHGWDAVCLDIDPLAAETSRLVNGCKVHLGQIVDTAAFLWADFVRKGLACLHGSYNVAGTAPVRGPLWRQGVQT